MRSGIKYVALGVTLGASAAALFGLSMLFLAPILTPAALAAFTVSAIPGALTPVPNGTPSSPPTDSPTPSFTPMATLVQLRVARAAATAIPDTIQIALDNGSIEFAGPLSNEEQLALYRSSLNYIRSSSAESQRLAKQINGVGYGDPTNICGPLAVAILRDAKLVPGSLQPHAFWLLNPNAGLDARILETAFPWGKYSHFFIATPINKTDWQTSPLLPGDFLFIWHGSGGNFDHMLVVTRVDSNSRAYAVTNYATDAGYVIAEALLYDPADPTAGLFHQWTAEHDAILGSTGFGGFEVWRRRTP
jgi:hypothetical protein